MYNLYIQKLNITLPVSVLVFYLLNTKQAQEKQETASRLGKPIMRYQASAY